MNQPKNVVEGIGVFVRRAAAGAVLATVALLSGCAAGPEALARKHMERGADGLAKADLHRAILEFKIASQNTPAATEPLYQLGLAYVTAKDGPGAVNAFQRVLAIRENHPGALYQLARLKAEANQPEILNDSAEMLRKLLQERPANAPALYGLALVETKLDQADAATGHFAEALALKTDSMEDIRMVVGAASRKSDFTELKKLVSLATARLPGSAEMAAMAGNAALVAGDKNTAATEAARALGINPRQREALELQIRLASMAGRNDEVEAAARRLAALPGADTRTAYAEALMAHGKRELALQEYQMLRGKYPKDAGLKSRYIEALVRQGMLAQARTELDQAIAAEPKDTGLLLSRARLSLDENRTEEAGRDLSRLAELKFRDENVALEEARYRRARGEKMEEGNLLSEALKLNPRLLLARLWLSRLFNESGKADAALRVLDEATEAERNNPSYRLYRSSALMASGDWDEARTNIKAALQHGRTPDVLVQAAALAIHDNDLAGAQKALEEALKLKPADPGALTEMATVYMQRKQAREYLAWIEKYAEANPGVPLLQIYTARILRSVGKFSAARRDLDRAAAEGAGAQANVELAALDIVEGRIDDAWRRLDASVKKNDNASERALMADILVRKKDWPHAEEQLRAGLALTPGDSVAMINLAAVVSKNSKRTEEALPLAEKALALSPGNSAVESAGGWFYYLTGRYQQAIQHLEVALKSSDIAATRYRLAAACFKAGDQTCANAQYQTALKENPNDPERSEVDLLLKSR